MRNIYHTKYFLQVKISCHYYRYKLYKVLYAYRYAYENDLNVAILHPDNSTSEPGITVNQFTGTWKDPRWAGLEMDLLAAHFRWDKKMISNILGQESRIFTILRDPVDQFESSYSFHSLDKVYGMSLKELIQLLQNTSIAEIKKKYGGLRTKDGTFGRNQMSWDLGLNPNSFDDEKAIEKLIVEREKEFDLVMIAERSDESLILLRHLLCWPLESVTSLVSNTRKPEYVVKLNPEERQVLRQHWLGADDRLYRHFTNIFDAKIADFGQSAMKEEVGELRLANQNVKDRCVLKQVGNEELGDNYRSVHNKTLGYILNEYV